MWNKRTVDQPTLWKAVTLSLTRVAWWMQSCWEKLRECRNLWSPDDHVVVSFQTAHCSFINHLQRLFEPCLCRDLQIWGSNAVIMTSTQCKSCCSCPESTVLVIPTMSLCFWSSVDELFIQSELVLILKYNWFVIHRFSDLLLHKKVKHFCCQITRIYFQSWTEGNCFDA